MNRTLHEQMKPHLVFVPKARTADTYDETEADGVAGEKIVDRLGYDEALVVVSVGAIPSNGTLVVKVREGDVSTLSDAADVSGATTGTLTSLTPNATGYKKTIRVNLRGRDRYIGLHAVVANQTIPFSAQIILGVKDAEPVGFTPDVNASS